LEQHLDAVRVLAAFHLAHGDVARTSSPPKESTMRSGTPSCA
jgi:hypothetical protein